MSTEFTRIGAAVIAVIGFGAASVWSARAGLSDYYAHRDTVAGLERAISVMPGAAEYYYRLALLDLDDPARGAAALHRAVELQPLDAPSWIELGLRAEAGGDNLHAESYLLRAATADRGYLPRWTLTNYYFRHNNPSGFWRWAKASTEMMFQDAAPLFRLCEQVAPDGDALERIGVENATLRASYLRYLLEPNRLERAAVCARRLIREQFPPDTPLLLAACDRLVQKRPADAVDVWNALVDARVIPFSRLEPESGDVVTNSDFAVAPTSNGFDWRVSALEGISIAREEQPPGLRITFSGGEAENVEALSQFVPVEEDRDYVLRTRYCTSGIAPGSGLEWRLVNAATGASLTNAEMAFHSAKTCGSGGDAEARETVRTPPGCRVVRLALAYRRNSGMTRIEGFVILRKVMLEAAAPQKIPPRSRVIK